MIRRQCGLSGKTDGGGDFESWGHSQRIGIFNPSCILESHEEIFFKLPCVCPSKILINWSWVGLKYWQFKNYFWESNMQTVVRNFDVRVGDCRWDLIGRSVMDLKWDGVCIRRPHRCFPPLGFYDTHFQNQKFTGCMWDWQVD